MITLYVLRVYDDGNFESKSRYVASATVQVVGDAAHIVGFAGRFSRRTWREIVAALKDLGIRQMVIERRGKIKTVEVTHSLL